MGGPDRPVRPVADLRLPLGALAAWLTVLTVLGLPGGTGVAAGTGALLVSVGLLLARRSWTATAALVLGCAGAAGVAAAVQVAVVERSPLTGLAGDRSSVSVQLVVADDPRPLRAGPGPPRVAVVARVERLAAVGRSWSLGGRVLVLAPAAGWRELLPSQRLTADGTLSPPLRHDLTVAVLSARGAPRDVRPASLAQAAAGRVRAGLREAAAVLPEGPRGLLPGLVLGDTSGLGPGGRGGLPHRRPDPPAGGQRHQLRDRDRRRPAAAPGGDGGPAHVGGPGRCGAGGLRGARPALAERVAGGGDGRDRAARAGVRPAPVRVARTRRRGARPGRPVATARPGPRLRPVGARHPRAARSRTAVGGAAAVAWGAARRRGGAGGAGRGDPDDRPGRRRAERPGQPRLGAGEPARRAGGGAGHGARRARRGRLARVRRRRRVAGPPRRGPGRLARRGGGAGRAGARSRVELARRRDRRLWCWSPPPWP